MEPTVTKNNGTVATLSDGTETVSGRFAEYGYNGAIQRSAFLNIFIVGRTKAEIRAILQDPNKIAEATDADGKPTGTTIPRAKFNVGDKGFSSVAVKLAENDADLTMKRKK